KVKKKIRGFESRAILKNFQKNHKIFYVSQNFLRFSKFSRRRRREGGAVFLWRCRFTMGMLFYYGDSVLLRRRFSFLFLLCQRGADLQKRRCSTSPTAPDFHFFHFFSLFEPFRVLSRPNRVTNFFLHKKFFF